MKVFVCDVCGKSNLLKQDELFVCQDCGCKYSAEDVRKRTMGNADAAPVNAGTPSLENLKVLAARARMQNDVVSAERFYSQIILMNPHDWEAAFYLVYFGARREAAEQNRIPAKKMVRLFAGQGGTHLPNGNPALRVTMAVQTAFSLIQRNVADPQARNAATYEIANAVRALFVEMYNSALTTLSLSRGYVAERCLTGWITPSVQMMADLADRMLYEFGNCRMATQIYDELISLADFTRRGYQSRNFAEVRKHVLDQRNVEVPRVWNAIQNGTFGAEANMVRVNAEVEKRLQQERAEAEVRLQRDREQLDGGISRARAEAERMLQANEAKPAPVQPAPATQVADLRTAPVIGRPEAQPVVMAQPEAEPVPVEQPVAEPEPAPVEQPAPFVPVMDAPAQPRPVIETEAQPARELTESPSMLKLLEAEGVQWRADQPVAAPEPAPSAPLPDMSAILSDLEAQWNRDKQAFEGGQAPTLETPKAPEN